MPEEQTSTEKQHCSLLRRLAAIVYDLLLLLAVWFMVTLIIVIVNRGAAINPGNVIYSLVLLIMGFGFFGWFWTHGGQTLGMRAWRIRIQSTDGTPIRHRADCNSQEKVKR
jgi:uncharacterized RDD family membrane protein YckC